MDLLLEGANLIRGTEAQLRELLARAAERAQYDDLKILAEWAKQLHALLRENGSAMSPASAGQLSNVPDVLAEGPRHIDTGNSSVLPSVAPAVSPAPAQTTPSHDQKRGPEQARAGRSVHRRGSQLGNYPQFLREGQSLVKIGWSKKGKAPYEHKAPKWVAVLVVELLQRAGGGGRRFTTDEMLPLKYGSDNSEIPSYQVYLTLAWLRSERLLIQHGRQGYSLPKGVELARSMEQRWKELPQR